MKSVPVPPKHEKYCVDVSCLERTGMHYMTHRFHQMQKHKFGTTCPEALFVKSVLVPPEQEKYYVDVSCIGCTGIDYMTRRSHRK
jgi:hypothetical protein